MLFFDVNHNLMDYNVFCGKYGIDDDSIGRKIDELVELKILSEEFMEYHYDKSSSPKQFNLTSNIWVEIKKNKVYDDGEYLGIVYIIYNITRMKEVENKIIQATNNLKANNLKIEQENQNKVESLQKVHHRIKNNLQTLLSFINLDKRFLEEDIILFNSINRIYAISLIHQNTYHELNPNLFSELYQISFDKDNINNDGFSKINLNDFFYSLGEFIKDNCDSVDFMINYDMDESLVFDIDLISPLSLIFIELIYNSIYYDFNEDENNEIDFQIKKIEDDGICFIYKDNHNKLPNNFNFNSSKDISVIIINSLVNQIRALSKTCVIFFLFHCLNSNNLVLA